MTTKMDPKPAHLHTVTPCITIKDAVSAPAFYAKAFGATSCLMVYFDDVDAAFDRAVKAGCKVKMPLSNVLGRSLWPG